MTVKEPRLSRAHKRGTRGHAEARDARDERMTTMKGGNEDSRDCHFAVPAFIGGKWTFANQSLYRVRFETRMRILVHHFDRTEGNEGRSNLKRRVRESRSRISSPLSPHSMIVLEAEVTSKLLFRRPRPRRPRVQYHTRRLSECGVSGGVAWWLGGCRSDNGRRKRGREGGTANRARLRALPPSLSLLMEWNGRQP